MLPTCKLSKENELLSIFTPKCQFEIPAPYVNYMELARILQVRVC